MIQRHHDDVLYFSILNKHHHDISIFIVNDVKGKPL